jgi:hypothetical protein
MLHLEGGVLILDVGEAAFDAQPATGAVFGGYLQRVLQPFKVLAAFGVRRLERGRGAVQMRRLVGFGPDAGVRAEERTLKKPSQNL